MDTAAQKACAYILNRIQTDPDLRYYAGPFTETFHLLCAAQAECTGRPLAEIEAARAMDLQPQHRTRQPEVLALKARLEAVGAVDAESLRADRDYYKAAYSRKLDDEKRALETAAALADALKAVVAERAIGCAGRRCGGCIECHARAALRAAGVLP